MAKEGRMGTLDLNANGVACAFCREQPVAFRYRTVAVEMPTPDGGIFRGDEADWNVCANCADLVETRRWADLTERVYAVRAAATPLELHDRVREAARQTVDLFGSAALVPRRPLIDLGGTLNPLPTPQEIAAFTTSLVGDNEEEDGPEAADWEWLAEEIERAKAAGALQADWAIGSDLSAIGAFHFAFVHCRLNDAESEVQVLTYHEYDGAWGIFFDVLGMDDEEMDLGWREVVPVLQRAEAMLQAAGTTTVKRMT
jgi:hypothetical protein